MRMHNFLTKMSLINFRSVNRIVQNKLILAMNHFSNHKLWYYTNCSNESLHHQFPWFKGNTNFMLEVPSTFYSSNVTATSLTKDTISLGSSPSITVTIVTGITGTNDWNLDKGQLWLRQILTTLTFCWQSKLLHLK